MQYVLARIASNHTIRPLSFSNVATLPISDFLVSQCKVHLLYQDVNSFHLPRTRLVWIRHIALVCASMYDRARVCIVRMHEKSLTVLEEVLLSGGADIQVLMTAMPLQQHLIFECLCLSAALCVCVCVCVCAAALLCLPRPSLSLWMRVCSPVLLPTCTVGWGSIKCQRGKCWRYKEQGENPFH